MNYKQKLGYMALGAGILAIGIIIGQIIAPDIKAQSNGVFDIIRCRQLWVVDDNGEIGIIMASSENNDHIILGGLNKGQVVLSASTTGSLSNITLSDLKRNPRINLSNTHLWNQIDIRSKAGNTAISLKSLDSNNDITIYDQAGNINWIAPEQED